MNQVRFRWLFPFWFFLLLLAACERQKAPAPPAAEEKAKIEEVQPARAVAELKPTEGSTVAGTVTFTAENGAVRVVAVVDGLEPGLHGFHIHEYGDCSAPDAASAGGHFNPGGTPHGAPDAPLEQRHAGDLGNVEADAAGKAHYERVDQVISLAGPNSIVGKAVIVHAQGDDLTSQPTGDAGPRLACGVIQAQE
jgi:Cu-Zn family superoxide dismutase